MKITKRSIKLGAREATVSFPPDFNGWFADFGPPTDRPSPETPADVEIRCAGANHLYRVDFSGIPVHENLVLGDALATAWERLAYLLIDEMSDGLALHAGAVRRDDAVVLIPGASGSGKTHLVLWLEQNGYEIETDEVYAVSQIVGDAETLRGHAFQRPIILKREAAPVATGADGDRLVSFAGGGIMKPAKYDTKTGLCIQKGIVIFPSFVPGASLAVTALTAAEAATELMGSCLNSRNLPRGGIQLAGAVARKLPAIKLIYGDSAQLKSTLDVLIRQLIAAKPSHGDLCVLCEAFTAKAQSDFISRRPASASAPASITKAIVEPNAMLPKTEARFPRRLSIGMATYDDYDGAYFTIQSIRAQNPDLSAQLEFIVVDNNPTGVCARALKDLEKTVDGYRYIPRGDWSGTAIKNAVFEEASSEFVLCLDSHVLLVPGAIAKLLDYMESGRAQRDLLQGPLLDDDLQKISTHFDPIWRGGMYGVWGTDPRGLDVDAEPFDIPMQGMGLFACSRDAWPRFNPAFRGFGGEEGYIHEKVRQLGGRSICLPFLRWVHRFNRPLGVPYRNTWEDRIRNYYLGFNELGLNTADMETHFQQLLGKGVSDKIVADIKAEMSGAGALDVLSMAQDVRKIAHR